MSGSYKIEVECHCGRGDPLRCQIHDKDDKVRAAAWEYRSVLRDAEIARLTQALAEARAEVERLTGTIATESAERERVRALGVRHEAERDHQANLRRVAEDAIPRGIEVAKEFIRAEYEARLALAEGVVAAARKVLDDDGKGRGLFSALRARLAEWEGT